MDGPSAAPRIRVMRSALGQARGLGAAKSGVGHWWAQRLTSLALLPLTLWFVWAVLAHAGGGYLAVTAWAHAPVNTVLLLCLVLATFHHMQLGLQVVLEDYIHVEPARVIALLAMRAATYLLGLAAVVAVLKLAFQA